MKKIIANSVKSKIRFNVQLLNISVNDRTSLNCFVVNNGSGIIIRT